MPISNRLCKTQIRFAYPFNFNWLYIEDEATDPTSPLRENIIPRRFFPNAAIRRHFNYAHFPCSQACPPQGRPDRHSLAGPEPRRRRSTLAVTPNRERPRAPQQHESNRIILHNYYYAILIAPAPLSRRARPGSRNMIQEIYRSFCEEHPTISWNRVIRPSFPEQSTSSCKRLAVSSFEPRNGSEPGAEMATV
jgi:hypothetical protein